ncbi:MULTISPECIES: YbaB/EbfC family nucleoid-associated protein [Nocardia]|uniref:YbaB/EbfC family nucleoid-associated protein n=1 Tax=Nocardia aurea TaxID=2144174 RepID=A0ABV3FQ08_9NOCA|nr:MULTISPECIES: YbaB/EbfC family nucleoid-associated protein [Nocardia]
MGSEYDEGDLASVIDAFQDQMRAIALVQQQRVKLTASATSRDKLVTVTVNANGIVIETKFSAGIGELGYDEIAKTVTKTAQEAAAEVARKNQELAAPITERRARLPKLSEVIEGMPDFEREIPLEPPVSTAPPGAAERGGDEEPMVFADVEEFDHEARSEPASGVSDSSW